MEIKIYYEDTDCGNVVYYANYLKFFERARTDYMNKRGVDLKACHDKGVFFMVASAKVDYRSPSHYGETIVVDTWISKFGGASFIFQYKITEKESKRIVVEGETTIVMVDTKQKLKRLEADMVNKLK